MLNQRKEDNQNEYNVKLQKMNDEELQEESKNMIWHSAFAANNPTADVHWQADACYDEAYRRGNTEIYNKAFEDAKALAGC